MSDPIHHSAQALAAETIDTRRDFHRHPELAFEEERTAEIIAKRLESLGLPLRRGVGKTGVVAVLEGAKPGKTVVLRADIDALPIDEENDVPYRSTQPGKMHACGHDGHAAVLLSAAKLLSEMRSEIAGTLVFVFQPAEEVVGGAQAMLEDGALEGLDVDHSLGLHLTSSHPTGTVALRDGPSMAASDAFHLTVRGRGGHAAMPHFATDPIVIGAQIITAAQSLIAREVDPVDQAVISFTAIQGGSAYNVIPEALELKGTLRTFLAPTRERLKTRLGQLVEGVAEAMRGEASLEWLHGSPAVVNDPAMNERLRALAREVVGVSRVRETPPIMGGDDMALWLEAAPGSYFFLGSGNPEKGTDFPHHHPRFDLDEDALPIAVELLSKGALAFLR